MKLTPPPPKKKSPFFKIEQVTYVCFSKLSESTVSFTHCWEHMAGTNYGQTH